MPYIDFGRGARADFAPNLRRAQPFLSSNSSSAHILHIAHSTKHKARHIAQRIRYISLPIIWLVDEIHIHVMIEKGTSYPLPSLHIDYK